MADRRRSRWGAATAAALATLLALGLLSRTPVPGALSAALRPFAGAGTWIADRFDWVTRGRAELAREADRLEAALAALSADRSELERLRDENAQLRERLSFASRTRFETLQAAIILRDGSERSRRFVIDRGTEDGVRPGAAVVAGDGQYVGKVIEAGPGRATVAVATAPGEKTAVTLLNLTRTIGIAEGTGHPLADVRFIPHDQDVAVNDLVVTSGLEDAVPAGLVLGVVNAVQDDPTAPFQSAAVEPLIDLRRTASVAVLIDRSGL